MRVTSPRSFLPAVLVAIAALLLTVLAAPHADAARIRHHAVKSQRFAAWAPAGQAAIAPGTQMYTDGAQCTANFVYTDGAGNVYVGYAAHCAGTGAATDTDGCQTRSLPLGTRVTFNEGGSPLDDGTVVGRGRLAYSSWLTMQQKGTTDANTCAYNDLALVQVDPADVVKVNPSVPTWGGPVGVSTATLAPLDRLYTYGNSSLRGGVSVFSPKVGLALGDAAADGGWSHGLYSISPGIPGDSGSGFLDADGNAIGVLSTVGLLPLPLSNNIGDLARELSFAQANSGIAGLRLTPGTEPFAGLG